jgi:hypothetical protein
VSVSLILACVVGVILIGLLLWKVEFGLAKARLEAGRKAAEREAELERIKQAAERNRSMLYDDMTVDEAQKIVWAWEEMSEEERREMPLDRRVQIRQIMADLDKHRRRYPEPGS